MCPVVLTILETNVHKHSANALVSCPSLTLHNCLPTVAHLIQDDIRRGFLDEGSLFQLASHFDKANHLVGDGGPKRP